jgi:hypothetical protein
MRGPNFGALAQPRDPCRRKFHLEDNNDVKSRVFLSCGQHPEERETANKVGKLLEARGFNVYIAIDVQTILEINTRIIRELKDSDCYLCVNFCREKIGAAYRGSLFSNQELAIAYALGFERILVINQKGILPEGMLALIGINTETFDDLRDCCSTVERALDRAGWTTDYSRRLGAGTLRFSHEVIGYRGLAGRFLYLEIRNNRPDIAALETTARLSEFSQAGQAWRRSRIRSPLKATGRPDFSHTIFPKSHEAFDLLCIGISGRPESPWQVPAVSGALVESDFLHKGEPGVFLNTALDVVAAQRLPLTPGVWVLRYEFFAIDFPVLSVEVELSLPNWNEPSARVLSEDII